MERYTDRHNECENLQSIEQVHAEGQTHHHHNESDLCEKTRQEMQQQIGPFAPCSSKEKWPRHMTK